MKDRQLGIKLVFLLFLALTFNPLIFQSFWENEGKYIFTAKQSLSDIVFYNAKDQSPLYFFFLHYWMKLFGTGEWVLRLPSVLFGGLAVYFLYRLGTLLAGPSLGFLSALLLSFSPLVVGMSQEVKHWTLFLFLSILSVFFLIQYLQEGRKKHLVAFGFTMVASFYACFYTFSNFFAMALFLACLCFVKKLREEELPPAWRLKTRELGFTFFIVALSMLPQFFLMRSAVDFVNFQGAQWGLPRVFPTFFLLAAKDLIGFSYRGSYEEAWLGMGLFFLVLGLVRSDWKVGLFAFFWIVPMLWGSYEMAAKASIRERYFLALIPACLVLMASGVLSIPWRRFRFLVIFLMMAMASPSLVQYYMSRRDDGRNFKNEDWRGALRYLQSRFQEHDAIILIPGRVQEGFMTYSDLPLILKNQLDLDQFLHYARAWVITVYNDLTLNPPYPVLDKTQFSNLWVKLYQLHPLGDFSPEKEMGTYDFRGHLKKARVSFELMKGGSIPYPIWKRNAYHIGYSGEIGSWGEGLIGDRWEPRKNLSIPEEPWKTVVATYQESGGKLRPAIWAHPVVGGIVKITYPEVPMNQWLRGFYGFTDYSVTQGKAPVQFEVRIGGEKVFGALKANQPGWKDFAVSTERWKGTRQTVAFSIAGGNIRWRHFCFNAWADDQNVSKVKLRFVGDTMFARGVGAVIEKKKDPFFPFRKTEAWLKGGDIAVTNLETSISDKGERVPSKEFYFRSPPQSAATLNQAGFDVVNLANNHILDYGPEAAVDTIRLLKEQGMEPVGLDADSSPPGQEARVVIRNGIRVAFLGYSFVPKQFQNFWIKPLPLDTVQMQEDVRNASRRADVVVVLTHWGHEYDYQFEDWQRSFAHAAIDAGAQLVVGSHPHVVQAVERYRQGVILYSLGDFVFDMPDDWRRLKSWPALAAEVTVNREGKVEETQLLPVRINEEYQPDFQKVFDAESLWVRDDETLGISYPFSFRLKEANLRLLGEKGATICDQWKTDRLSGPISFRDRWSCLGEPHFGITQIRERNQGVFRNGLLATLGPDTAFELRYTRVPSGKPLRGFYGWTDETLQSQVKKSADLEIFMDGKKRWSAQIMEEKGWKDIAIPLAGRPGKFHEVVWRIKNRGGASHLVFDGSIGEPQAFSSFQRIKTFSHAEDPDVLWPKSVKISPDGKYAYVQNLDGLNTMIFDAQTFKKLRLIRHEGKPVETAFTKKGRYVWISYLALIGDKYPPYQLEWTPSKGWDSEYQFPSVVAVLDTKKWEIIQKIGVGVRPKFLAASPDERYVLVSNWSSDSVSVIDAASYKVVKEIPVGTAPRGIAFSRDGKKAYVAVMRGQSIAVIDLKKLEVLRWIKEGIGEGPRHLVRNRAGDRLYLSANWSRKIQVMDLNQEKIIQNIDTGELPRSMVLSPDERFLYVDNYGDRRVSIIDLAQGREVASLETAEEPVGIDVTPDGRYLWVTNYRSHQIMIFGHETISHHGG